VIAETHDVHIQCAGTPPPGWDAIRVAFRLLSGVQKFLGGALGAQQDHLIEEIPLCRPTNGFGFLNPALSKQLGSGKPRQLSAPQAQVLRPVTEVRTKRYERPLKHRHDR
jgi:hypothetical protein